MYMYMEPRPMYNAYGTIAYVNVYVTTLQGYTCMWLADMYVYPLSLHTGPWCIDIHLSPTSDESRPLIGQLARVYYQLHRGLPAIRCGTPG